VFDKRQLRPFRIGKDQVVRIPRKFEFSREEVVLRKVENTLIVEPAPRKGLVDLLRTLEPIEDEFRSTADPTAEEVRFWQR
jgi:antitoxin VapB